MATTSSRPARQWRTYITPLILVIVWLGAAAFGGPLFGRVEEVSTNDQTQFLPSSAGATRVQEELPASSATTPSPPSSSSPPLTANKSQAQTSKPSPKPSPKQQPTSEPSETQAPPSPHKTAKQPKPSSPSTRKEKPHNKSPNYATTSSKPYQTPSTST